MKHAVSVCVLEKEVKLSELSICFRKKQMSWKQTFPGG